MLSAILTFALLVCMTGVLPLALIAWAYAPAESKAAKAAPAEMAEPASAIRG
jgi:hypothetical protein